MKEGRKEDKGRKEDEEKIRRIRRISGKEGG